MSPQHQRSAALLGFASSFYYALSLALFPLFPYAYLLPWVDAERPSAAVSQGERPLVLLLLVLLLFLPLSNLLLFWAYLRHLIAPEKRGLLWMISGYLLQGNFTIVLLITGLGLHNEFFGPMFSEEMQDSLISILVILLLLSLDLGILCLSVNFFSLQWFPARLCWLGLGLVLLQLFFDLNSISTEAPDIIYFASAIPLPLLVLALSGYWLLYPPHAKAARHSG
jgi:hypothetical protein